MNNEVSLANQADKEEKTTITEQVTELSEDMVMVSPGAMLREARKALSFSKEHIASKLNFKVGIVTDIENDTFDPLMPVTFNRGYLVNYAKLVGVDVVDVLSSYDALGAATAQRSEMLSFSNETTKQAEHSRVMWLSYFIVAVLIGLTILWWQQESRQQVDSSIVTEGIAPSTTAAKDVGDDIVIKIAKPAPVVEKNSLAVVTEIPPSITINGQASTTLDVATNAVANENPKPTVPAISTAVFTFNGDCWVNIFDATGERIAWGVKKSGYVMTIQGQAPLRITVGKPELTSIIFNGKSVDMSAFNLGNIAKFNLPIVE